MNATSEAIERERQAIEIVTQALSVFEELERHVAIALSLFAKLSGEGTTVCVVVSCGVVSDIVLFNYQEEQVIAFVDKVLRDGSVAMEEGAVRDAAGRLAGCFSTCLYIRVYIAFRRLLWNPGQFSISVFYFWLHSNADLTVGRQVCSLLLTRQFFAQKLTGQLMLARWCCG